MSNRQRSNATGRSAGEGWHVRLYHWMLNSTAYRSLDPAPRTLLVEIYKLFKGTNNGELYLSVRDAAKRINVSPATAARAFEDLKRVGFIRPNQVGSFNRKTRHATSWLLTEFSHGEQLATKDFMRWREAEIQNTVAPTRLSVSSMRPNGVTCETEALEKPATVSPVRLSAAEKPFCGLSNGTQIVNQGGGVSDGLLLAANEPAETPNESRPNLADAVRQKLKADRVTQHALARWLSLSRPTLSNYLAGRFRLNSDAEVMLHAWADGKVALKSNPDRRAAS